VQGHFTIAARGGEIILDGSKPQTENMKIDRRHFLATTSLALGAAGVGIKSLPAAEVVPSPPGGRQSSPLRLGLVTYNLAKDWDLATLIKNCAEAKFEGVELRTTHAHGVEVTLSKAQRADVKARFENSPVQLVSLGSIFDYHTPDQAKLRRDIEATKEYIVLAKEVGAAGVKVRPNALPKEVPKEKTLEQIGRSLRELGDFGQQHGISIRLEVHGTETSLVPNIRTILDAANHPNVGACWNSNQTDLAGAGFAANFDLLQGRILAAHITELYNEEYPYRRLFARLKDTGFTGYCLAEIPESKDPVRLMKYYRGLWLALQAG
jgi:sugar phosphate isomerase/epimerase